MNCLTYLLQLLSEGHSFKILYNGNHCIGVNRKRIFEIDDTFKQDLLAGYSLRGGDVYLPLEEGFSHSTVVKIFSLNQKEQKLLEDYYEQNT